jgi:hypothetical protein
MSVSSEFWEAVLSNALGSALGTGFIASVYVRQWFRSQKEEEQARMAAIERRAQDEEDLLTILFAGDRSFYLVYNLEEKKGKTIKFLPNGRIHDSDSADGTSENECRWKIIDGGNLEISTIKGEMQSRFRFDREKGLLVHTNDPNSLSALGQYMYPKHRIWSRNSDVGEKGKALVNPS